MNHKLVSFFTIVTDGIGSKLFHKKELGARTCVLTPNSFKSTNSNLIEICRVEVRQIIGIFGYEGFVCRSMSRVWLQKMKLRPV